MQEELPPGAINIQYIRPTRLSRSRPHSFSNGKRYHHVCWRWGCGLGWVTLPGSSSSSRQHKAKRDDDDDDEPRQMTLPAGIKQSGGGGVIQLA